MDKDDIYLEMAHVISKLSKDSGTKVGAIIVASNGTPVSWGYNGNLSGISESLIPATREQEEVDLELETFTYPDDPKSCISISRSSMKLMTNKYPFTFHAESNAIHFASKKQLIGATIYQTYVPCIQCAKDIVRAKIKRVVCPANSLASDSLGSEIGKDFDEVLAILATGEVSIKIGNKEYKPRIKKEITTDESRSN